MTTMTNNIGISQPNKGAVTLNSLPDIWLNTGKNSHAANTAITAPASVTSIDSVKNWAIRYLRGDPRTLRTPTSRARLAERAVERFMKLTQAITRIKIAIAEKMYT